MTLFTCTLLKVQVLIKGKAKIYAGVPGNLVAFACQLSFDKSYEGFLAFDAKTSLIKHYQETLHATHFKGTKCLLKRRQLYD